MMLVLGVCTLALHFYNMLARAFELPKVLRVAGATVVLRGTPVLVHDSDVMIWDATFAAPSDQCPPGVPFCPLSLS